MKILRRLLIFTFITSWVLYLITNWLFSLLGRPFDYFNVIIVGLIFSALVSAMTFFLIRSLLKVKLDFLSSNTASVPAFADKMQKNLHVERSDFSFEVIKYKIAEHYKVILYDDVEGYIIKFYSGLSLSSWGVGGCVHYDAVTKIITLTSFPLNAYTEKAAKNTETVLHKVENMIATK